MLISFLIGFVLELHTVATGVVHRWSVEWPVRVEDRCPPILIERHECSHRWCVEHDLCVSVDTVVICSEGHRCAPSVW